MEEGPEPARRPAQPTPPAPPSALSSGPAAVQAAPGSHAAAALRRPTFHGRGATLAGIHVVNVLLILTTLGIYYFWARTRVRRYLFSQTEIERDRFAYHGTGKELLLGTLKAALVFGVPVLLMNVVSEAPAVPEPVQIGTGLIAALLFFVFLPVALVGGRRYRLARTSWRGIRFSFRGSVREIMRIFLRGTLYTVLTLGLYYPFFLVARQKFLVSHSYFGNERFEFDGRGRDLFRPFLVSILLTLPTLGVCWIWYVARKRRYFWDHTTFGTARFSCTVTGVALLGLWVVNTLLLVGTLGVAWPWVRVRSIHFAFRNLAMVGALELERIEQDAQSVSAIGEGLAGFFDSGFDLA
jgi:uncharacterized membrane protein YjgN (DUF898 family)